jgi:hypothetical protein
MNPKSQPLVYVVVLNWNNYEDTKKCLSALMGEQYPSLKTVVVDNGSADNSVFRLRDEFPNVTFIHNEENLGFSRGCNVGIRAALADPLAAYVLLLNNDAEISPGGLATAIEAAETDRRIGLVSGKILCSREGKRIWYAGGEVLRWRGGVRVRGAGETDRGQYDTAGEVGFITGALMLIKREVLTTVGLLPEEYFFGVEEYEYSYMVKRAGFKLIYAPSFLVYHSAEGSHSNHALKYVYLGYRSKLIMQQRLLPPGFFPVWKVAFRLYGRFLARRAWRALRKSTGVYDNNLDEMEFALSKAIADHGKDTVSESTLSRFEKELDRYRQQGMHVRHRL